MLATRVTTGLAPPVTVIGETAAAGAERRCALAEERLGERTRRRRRVSREQQREGREDACWY